MRVQLDGVSKYYGAQVVVEDVTLTVGPQSRLGLVGPNGVGTGGEAARAALAAILLSRFDLFLLDEPTYDLDFDGLDRLERFLAVLDTAVVVVSHDRAFLDRTVTRIAEIEPGSRRLREWAGGWTEYEAARDTARRAAYAAFEDAQQRRRELGGLLSKRRTEAVQVARLPTGAARTPS